MGPTSIPPKPGRRPNPFRRHLPRLGKRGSVACRTTRGKADTITLVKSQWDASLSDSLVVLRKQELKVWIEQELNTNDVEVISN